MNRGGGRAVLAIKKQCWKVSQYCQLYAVDNTVVWPRQESAPSPTNFASFQDVNAVPYLHADGRQAYARYLAVTRPRAFAIARDGGWGQASGIDSINAALVQCALGREECRVYSVDGDVVWATK